MRDSERLTAVFAEIDESDTEESGDLLGQQASDLSFAMRTNGRLICVFDDFDHAVVLRHFISVVDGRTVHRGNANS